MSLDLIESINAEGAGDRAPSTLPECPRCGITFQPKRRNQRYCTTDCQKKASRNSARGSTSATDSADRRHTKRRQRATLAWLNETYYTTPPGQRLGLLKEWLDTGRAGDTQMKSVLTRPDFLRRQEQGACFRYNLAYPPVPYLADRFAKRFLGCTSGEWLSGRAAEPETGEVDCCG